MASPAQHVGEDEAIERIGKITEGRLIGKVVAVEEEDGREDKDKNKA